MSFEPRKAEVSRLFFFLSSIPFSPSFLKKKMSKNKRGKECFSYAYRAIIKREVNILLG